MTTTTRAEGASWTVAELAEAVGCTPRNIRKHIDKQNLKAERRGWQWFIPDAEARRWILLKSE